MKLNVFLNDICRTRYLPDKAVMCFSGTSYPILFFSHIITFLKKNHTIDHIDITADVSLLKVRFSMEQFSGPSIYWLGDISSGLSAKQQSEWISYFQSYKGSHKILFFCTESALGASKDASSSMLTVPIPELIIPQEFDMVAALVASEGVGEYFLKNIAQRVDTLSLDNACLLANYGAVLGKNSSLFFQQWFDTIIEPQTSLFLLSQHLFAKKATLFFKQWSLMEEKFLPPFWISYFADQVWHAYLFCYFMKQKNFAAAKKVQYKLPYSFINRDWRLYSTVELCTMHQFLYKADFHFKNGGTPAMLELFFCSFLNNKFK